MWVAANAASRTPGRTNGFLDRRSNTCSAGATRAPAPSLAAIAASTNAPRLANVGRWSVDDLDRAGDHQPTGCAEKAADHRVGHETDRAAGMGKAEHAEQQPRQRGRQRHRDQRRTEQSVAARGDQLLHDRRNERGDDDGDGTVRPGDGEGQRTAQRHNRSADRRRQECDGDAVGKQRSSGPVKISAA